MTHKEKALQMLESVYPAARSVVIERELNSLAPLHAGQQREGATQPDWWRLFVPAAIQTHWKSLCPIARAVVHLTAKQASQHMGTRI